MPPSVWVTDTQRDKRPNNTAGLYAEFADQRQGASCPVCLKIRTCDKLAVFVPCLTPGVSPSIQQVLTVGGNGLGSAQWELQNIRLADMSNWPSGVLLVSTNTYDSDNGVQWRDALGD